MAIKKYLFKAANYLNYQKKVNEMAAFLPQLDFESINNRFVTNNHNIIFVILKMTKFSGGLTSILRIAKELKANGFSVFYCAYDSDDLNEMTSNAAFNLSDFAGEFITLSEAKKRGFEFVIASNWQSVYFAKQLNGYKVIFAQDYEPYFYAVGDEWLLAKKSYELGFDVISLGAWNLAQIKHNIDGIKSNLYSVTFPFEKCEYPTVRRDFDEYRNLRKIKIAVYMRMEQKRMPALILSLLEEANKYMLQKGFELDIYYYGLKKLGKTRFGNNCGKLSKAELFDLYKNCHFGLVASLTNISLVPYEMLSTNLPIFEFEDGSYPGFLGHDTATLIDLDYRHFADKLIGLLNEPKILEKQIENASKALSSLSWKATGAQFADILLSIEKKYEQQ